MFEDRNRARRGAKAADASLVGTIVHGGCTGDGQRRVDVDRETHMTFQMSMWVFLAMITTAFVIAMLKE